jgi:hypothetical protein
MYKDILSEKQAELLILIKQFIREYYLVGGTAIALHIGHRRSIDFDLFKYGTIKHSVNLKKISSFEYPYHITRRVEEQMNLTINEVKVTFYQYPFKIDPVCRFEDVLRLPDLIDLAAMKAYALGRRSKWKDYVDLYFIIKSYYSIDQISKRAFELFDQMFSEKLFRAQLSYFKDIDYSEQVEYLCPSVPVDDIKKFLIEKAIDIVI